MAILTDRERQALSSTLWRYKRIIRRNRCKTLMAYNNVMIYSVVLIMLTFFLKQGSVSLKATDSITVTGTNTINPNNYWVQPDQNILGNFSMSNCSSSNEIYGSVGIVLSPFATPFETLALQQIQETISAAYSANNEQDVTMNFEKFDSYDLLQSHVKSPNYYKSQLCFAFEFTQFDIVNKQFEFGLYFNSENLGGSTRQNQTNYQNAPFFVQKNADKEVVSLDEVWDYSGFQQLMTTATESIITQVLSNDQIASVPNFSIAYLPQNTGLFEFGILSKISTLIFTVIIIFIYTVSGQIEKIINEKEEKQIENMLRLSGMSQGVLVAANWIILSACTLPFILLLSLIGKFFVAKNVSFMIILLLILLVEIQFVLIKDVLGYGLGRGTLAFFVRILYLIAMALVSVLQTFMPSKGPALIHGLAILFPQTQIQSFFEMAAFLNQSEENSSINITNLGQTVFGTTFTSVLVIAMVMPIIFALIFTYLWPMNVNPNPSRPLKFYYPLTCSYWCPKEKDDDLPRAIVDAEEDLVQPLNRSEQIIENVTPEELQMIAQGDLEKPRGDESSDRLIIQDLTKKFGQFTAVDNLSLTMFKDQILVLLGHNGAGKTTTINMLIGHLKATSGEASAFGNNLLQTDSNVKDLVSVCPQQNVLLEKLTVQENLEFFAMLRGVENTEEKILVLLEQFHMSECKENFPDKISGGQKRRLQLMISLLGDFKVILLDEPSSGMDPNLRRETWDILKSLKKDKIIIMTTHYMDEAEYLGDRVAIMSHGKLKTCGSSLFLKNKFSDDLIIEVKKMDVESNLDGFRFLFQTALTELGMKEEQMKVTREQDKEIFTLPKQINTKFQQLFNEVDANLKDLNIESYIVRTSSLEEVFIQIGEREKSQLGESESQEIDLDYKPELGHESAARTLNTYFLMTCRSRTTQCVSSVIVMIFLMSFSLIQLAISCATEPSLTLTSVPSIFTNQPMPLTVYDYYGDSTSAADLMSESLFEANSMKLEKISGLDTQNYTQALQDWADYIQAAPDQEYLEGSYFVANVPTVLDGSEQLSVAVTGNLRSASAQNVFGAVMLNRIAQWYANDDSLQITFINKPLPTNKVLVTRHNNSFLLPWSYFMLIALTLMTTLSIQINADRFNSGYFQLIMTKGGDKYSYIFGLYLSDFFVHVVVMSIMMMFLVFGGIKMPGMMLGVSVFCLCNPIFILLVSYFTMYAKRWSQSAAYLLITLSQAITYFDCLMIGSIAFQPSWFGFGLAYAKFNAFIPMTTLINTGVYSLSSYYYASLYDVSVEDVSTMQFIGPLNLIQGIAGLVYLVLLIVILEGFCFKKPRFSGLKPTNQSHEDDMVKQERQRVMAGSSGPCETVKVVDFVKQYEGKDPNPQEQDGGDRPVERPSEVAASENDDAEQGPRAVDGISFGVKQGEILALLGLSGAGKSSTFNMLLGDESISGGEAYLNEKSLSNMYLRPHMLHKLVGYCPQYNNIESFTVEKSLYYIAELVGIKPQQVQRHVNRTMRMYDLIEHKDKSASNLSGGNKRKLCCAQALMGCPPVMFVDEVSAGVDPVARRKVWKAMQLEGKNSALVLTTHTMEEAESLANKIGIMASGKFKCFGTLQQIQKKHGSGFEVEMNLRSDDLQIELEKMQPEHRFCFDFVIIKGKITEWQNILQNTHKKNMALDFADEFSKAGLYGHLWQQVHKGQKIDLVLLQKDIQVQNAVAQIVQELNELASFTEVVSFDGQYLVLRIQQKDELTYGRLYTIMEELQKRLPLKEYSCKQATLEQIFNSFAQQDQLKLFNRRVSSRKATTLSI